MLSDMSKEFDGGEFELLAIPRVGEKLVSVKLGYYNVVHVVHVGRRGSDTPYVCVLVSKEEEVKWNQKKK